MKVFISQPMKDKTNEQIKEERAAAVSDIRKLYPNAEIIDSFFEDAPHDANPLWFLAKSLEKLSTADAAYFCSGWENARGCKLEHAAATEYGIYTIEPY